MPTHDFGTYEADLKQDIDNVKLGVSLVCDLGFRLALENDWGIYLGVYGGYGIISQCYCLFRNGWHYS